VTQEQKMRHGAHCPLSGIRSVCLSHDQAARRGLVLMPGRWHAGDGLYRDINHWAWQAGRRTAQGSSAIDDYCQGLAVA
jgi:hypothetical protein